MLQNIFGVIAVTAAVLVSVHWYSDTPIVRTPDCGKIIGSAAFVGGTGRKTYNFYGIPYALPPVGNRRFKPPQALHEEGDHCYAEPLDARYDPQVSCIQPSEVFQNLTISEDCLHLTVMTPELKPEQALPVLFWIHGGGLITGNNHVHGYSFTADEVDALGAVVVNVNYRLGLLGFLQAEPLWEEGKSYGNYGIRDIITALSWVQRNIASFGGDPNSVTVIGESAGATSTLALLVSPLADGLFHRVVALSPGPEMRDSHEKGAVKHRDERLILEKTGCQGSDDVGSCLRQATTDSLTIKLDITKNRYFNFPLKHGVPLESLGMIFTDPVTIPVPPRDLAKIKHKPNHKIRVIISGTESESTLNRVFRPKPEFETFDDLFEKLEGYYKNLEIAGDPANFVEDLKGLYSEAGDPASLYELLTSDIRSTCPLNDIAGHMGTSNHHDIYRVHIGTAMEHHPHFPAYHAWDTDAIFGYRNTLFRGEYQPGPRDLKLRDGLRHLLRQFMRDDMQEWEKYPLESIVFGNSDPLATPSRDPPRARQCAFLKSYGLDKYGAQN